MNKRLVKIFRYEFWPMWIFYAPFVSYWIWNSFKSGSFSYFCKVNPGIKFGGFLDYSKYEILKQIPEEFLPKTKLISNKNQLNPLPEFPFIVKPDFGERGINVEVIRNETDWKNYLIEGELIIQEFIDLSLEFGIFYTKFPDENSGKILSITGKEFLHFESDGISTLEDFIKQNKRAYFRKEYLLKKFKNQLNEVYPKGTKILLEPIGNHNRGTIFYDASHLISNELTQKINNISNEIEGFYYGRFDVKSESEADLKKGNIIILEVNGANSEATHIYDPGYTILEAYKEVKRHLDIQFKISKMNSKNHSEIEFFKAIRKRLF